MTLGGRRDVKIQLLTNLTFFSWTSHPYSCPPTYQKANTDRSLSFLLHPQLAWTIIHTHPSNSPFTSKVSISHPSKPCTHPYPPSLAQTGRSSPRKRRKRTPAIPPRWWTPTACCRGWGRRRRLPWLPPASPRWRTRRSEAEDSAAACCRGGRRGFWPRHFPSGSSALSRLPSCRFLCLLSFLLRMEF